MKRFLMFFYIITTSNAYTTTIPLYDQDTLCAKITKLVQSRKSIENKGLILRLLTMDDAEDIFRCASDIETTQFTPALGFYPHQSIEDTYNLLAEFFKSITENEMLVFTIRDQTSYQFLGVAMFEFTIEHARAEYIIVLDKQFWGQGIGTCTLRLLLNLGFTELGLHRIEADCDPLNIGSRKMIEKAGMKFEGYLHKYYIQRGESKDRLMYALTYEDYPTSNIE